MPQSYNEVFLEVAFFLKGNFFLKGDFLNG